MKVIETKEHCIKLKVWNVEMRNVSYRQTISFNEQMIYYQSEDYYEKL
jgi:hypothetical protein